VDEVPVDIPASSVLYFKSGPYNWARVVFDVEASEDETEIEVEPLAQNLAEDDIAPWPPQELVLIEAPLKVTPGIGAGYEYDRLLHTHVSPSIFTGSEWTHLGQKVAALTDGDSVDFVFGVKRDGGSDELHARIRFRRAGSSGLGSVYLETNGGSGFPTDGVGSPSIAILPTGRVAVNQSIANYTLDVFGDLNFTGELIGVNLWVESPAGGTPPFVLPEDSATVLNLDVDTLQGLADWPAVADEDAAPPGATVATPDTDETVATAAATAAGLYLIEGWATADIAAGDIGANFYLSLQLAGDDLTLEPGQLRLQSARIGPLFCLAQTRLAASDDIDLVVRKDGGSGSTAVDGNVRLTWIGV
jgi:hypothetical protein